MSSASSPLEATSASTFKLYVPHARNSAAGRIRPLAAPPISLALERFERGERLVERLGNRRAGYPAASALSTFAARWRWLRCFHRSCW